MTKLNVNPPEPSALIFDLPKGYVLVPKGNVFITKHCRSKTHAINRPVFIVHNHKKQTLGLGVPRLIFEEVSSLDEDTASTRAKAVEQKDSMLERKTQAELMKQFPKVPKDVVPSILKHMLKKHSGRVGRTSEPLPKVVRLGVRAHIRHMHTEYDKLLREGIDREEARDKIQHAVDVKVREWGGKPWSAPRISRTLNSGLRRKPTVHKVSKKKVTTKLVSRPKRVTKS